MSSSSAPSVHAAVHQLSAWCAPNDVRVVLLVVGAKQLVIVYDPTPAEADQLIRSSFPPNGVPGLFRTCIRNCAVADAADAMLQNSPFLQRFTTSVAQHGFTFDSTTVIKLRPDTVISNREDQVRAPRNRHQPGLACLHHSMIASMPTSIG